MEIMDDELNQMLTKIKNNEAAYHESRKPLKRICDMKDCLIVLDRWISSYMLNPSGPTECEITKKVREFNSYALKDSELIGGTELEKLFYTVIGHPGMNVMKIENGTIIIDLDITNLHLGAHARYGLSNQLSTLRNNRRYSGPSAPSGLEYVFPDIPKQPEPEPKISWWQKFLNWFR